MIKTVAWCCSNCTEELDVNVEVTSVGYPGRTGGPPEFCYPGEPPEWFVMKDVTCRECCTEFPTAVLNEDASLHEAVCTAIVEDAAAAYEDYDIWPEDDV